MRADRVTRLRIAGMRCIDRLDMEVSAFTVLIGANGSGKSTIVEAVKLVRELATANVPVDGLAVPFGASGLIRSGLRQLRVGVRIEGMEPALDYDAVLTDDSRGPATFTETLRNAATGQSFTTTTARRCAPMLHQSTSEARRMFRALTTLEVHAPRERGAHVSDGAPATERPSAATLERMYADLTRQPNWRETLGRLRLVLGELDDVVVPSLPNGELELRAYWRGGAGTPSAELSSGQRALLALVGLQQLQRETAPSLVVIDEPEAHLHPAVTRRVVIGLLEASADWPILIATQSDAVLDAVSGRPESLIRCRLDAERRTELTRLAPARVQAWLATGRSIGDLRREGVEDLVFSSEFDT